MPKARPAADRVNTGKFVLNLESVGLRPDRFFRLCSDNPDIAQRIACRQLPSSVEEGSREAAGGAVQQNQSLGQHHPGAFIRRGLRPLPTRHPSSSEEGSFCFVQHSLCKADNPDIPDHDVT